MPLPLCGLSLAAYQALWFFGPRRLSSARRGLFRNVFLRLNNRSPHRGYRDSLTTAGCCTSFPRVTGRLASTPSGSTPPRDILFRSSRSRVFNACSFGVLLPELSQSQVSDSQR